MHSYPIYFKLEVVNVTQNSKGDANLTVQQRERQNREV